MKTEQYMDTHKEFIKFLNERAENDADFRRLCYNKIPEEVSYYGAIMVTGDDNSTGVLKGLFKESTHMIEKERICGAVSITGGLMLLYQYPKVYDKLWNKFDEALRGDKVHMRKVFTDFSNALVGLGIVL